MRASILITALLSGCMTISSPQDVKTRGDRHDFKTSKSALAAAKCLERNAAEIRWDLNGIAAPARMRETSEAGTYEVILDNVSAPGTVAMIAVVRDGNYSIFSSPHMLTGALRGEGSAEEQMARGC